MQEITKYKRKKQAANYTIQRKAKQSKKNKELP